MLSEVDAQSLILCTHEDGAENEPRHEEEQKAVVHPAMVVRIEDTQQDQAGCSCDREKDTKPTEDLLRHP